MNGSVLRTKSGSMLITTSIGAIQQPSSNMEGCGGKSECINCRIIPCARNAYGRTAPLLPRKCITKFRSVWEVPMTPETS